MTRKRGVSADERAEFEKAFREATPIAPALLKRPAQPKPLGAGSGGLNGTTAEKLKRGEIEPQARLDLHGMTERAAHGALATFIRGAWSRGLRLVIVVTGKGVKIASDEPFDLERNERGLLKNMTPRWLKEPDLAPLIADVRSAHRSHGGSGALYVYLRKIR